MVINRTENKTEGIQKIKASSYIAQYPVLRTVQSALLPSDSTSASLLVHVSTTVNSQALIYTAE